MTDFTDDQLNDLANFGLTHESMTGNQKFAALIEQIKMQSAYLYFPSKDICDGKSEETLGEYLTDAKRDAAKLIDALNSLDELVNNPQNWKA